MFTWEGITQLKPWWRIPLVRVWSAHKNTQFDQLSKKHWSSEVEFPYRVSPVFERVLEIRIKVKLLIILSREMAEWSKAAVLKTVEVKASWGANPYLPAMFDRCSVLVQWKNIRLQIWRCSFDSDIHCHFFFTKCSRYRTFDEEGKLLKQQHKTLYKIKK